MHLNSEIWDESPQVISIKETMHLLNQVVQKLDENDYFSAQIMLGVSVHLLKNVQIEIEQHVQIERMLRKTLNNSINNSM